MKKLFLPVIAVCAIAIISCGSDEKKKPSSGNQYLPAAVQSSLDTTSTAIDSLFAAFYSSQTNAFNPYENQEPSLSKINKVSLLKNLNIDTAVFAADTATSTSYSGTFIDTTGYFNVAYSYDLITGVYEYTLTLLKDYTDTASGITFTKGGYEILKGSMTYTATKYTSIFSDTANFPYTQNGSLHSIAWTVNSSVITNTDQATSTISGTITDSGSVTIDGTVYTFSETIPY